MLTEFTRQLATLLQAGIPLAEGLELLRKTIKNPKTKDLCLFLRDQIEQGIPLSTAYKNSKHSIDPIFTALVTVGEYSGRLDSMLEHVANCQEKTQAIKRKLNTALVYPCTVVVIGLLVLLILLIKVIPTFEQLYQNAQTQLPLATQFLLDLSYFLKNHGLFLILSTALATLLSIKLNLKKILIPKIPILSTLIHKAFVARFARILATTCKAGLPLPEGLVLASQTTLNPAHQACLHKAQKSLLSGTPLSLTLKQTGIFPVRLLEMIRVGEETGKLDELLAKTANLIEAEYDSTVIRLSTLFEPVLLVVLGCIVGGFLLAMYLPLFDLGALW